MTTAHDNFVRYIQATYMSGGTENTTAGSLLTATDPSALLEQGTLEQYQSEHQINAIGQLQLATVQESNAEAAARKAVQVQADATKRAQDAADAAARAKQDAEDAVTAAQEQRAALEASVISTEHALDAARSHLATLNHERTKYIAYKRHQAALRRARIAAARAARARSPARSPPPGPAGRPAHHHHTDGGGTVITRPERAGRRRLDRGEGPAGREPRAEPARHALRVGRRRGVRAEPRRVRPEQRRAERLLRHRLRLLRARDVRVGARAGRTTPPPSTSPPGTTTRARAT